MSTWAAIPELLDRVREHYNQVEKELQELKTENRKLTEEKTEIDRLYVMSTEMLHASNLEKMTHVEIGKRMESLIQNNLTFFPQEHQQGLADAMARVKQVDQREIAIQMQAQAVATGMGQYGMHMAPTNGGGIVYAMPPGAAPGPVPVHGQAMMAHAPRLHTGDHGQTPATQEYNNNNHDSRPKHREKKRKHETENHDHDEDVDVSGTDVDKSNNSAAGVHNNGVHNGSSNSHHDSGRDSKPSSDREHKKKNRQAAAAADANSSTTVATIPQAVHHPAMMPATTQDGQLVFANGAQMFFPPGMRPPYIPQPMSMMQTHYPSPAGTEMVAAGYPTGAAAPPAAFYQVPATAYARPPFDTNHRPMTRPVPPQQVAQVPIPAAPVVAAPAPVQAPPGCKQPITYHYSDSKMTQVAPQSDFYTHPGMARSVAPVSTLQHNDVVCAVSIDSKTRRVYTGGKGVVKVWKMEQTNCETPLWQFDILDDSYIRSCKVLPDGKTMIVGGESTKLALYDLEARCRVGELTSMAPACYAVAISTDGQLVYSCCSNGQIVIWDMRTHRVEKQIHGHSDGASCLDLAREGTRLVTGGLDCKVRIWDARQTKEIKSYEYDSQVFSIGYTSHSDSGEKYVAVGLENSTIEMFNVNRPERYVSHLHEDAVLSLKFSSSGSWFVTTSKDTKLGVWGMPCGANLFHTKESRSILCCDVSADDKHIITGSGHNRAMLYEVQY